MKKCTITVYKAKSIIQLNLNCNGLVPHPELLAPDTTPQDRDKLLEKMDGWN